MSSERQPGTRPNPPSQSARQAAGDDLRPSGEYQAARHTRRENSESKSALGQSQDLGSLRRKFRDLPPDAYVPVHWVQSLLKNDTQSPRTTEKRLADLTVSEVGQALSRSPSTVRGWCASGKLKAYKLNGREWRVRPEDLQAFLDKQAQPGRKLKTDHRASILGKDPDLSAWKGYVSQKSRQKTSRGIERG